MVLKDLSFFFKTVKQQKSKHFYGLKFNSEVKIPKF